jgi:hypothetical protein
MGNTRNTGYLQNAIKVSDAGAISFMSGSTMLATINTSGQMSGSAPVLFASTASFVALAVSASNAVAAATASFANAFTVASTLTAQTLVVQTITSSIDFVTGSTRFGSLAANTHTFTGSVLVSGSIGIGLTNPSYRLHVSGAFSSNPGVYLYGTTYAMVGVDRGSSAASAGTNYYTTGSQRWFTGIYENTNNFGFYNAGNANFSLILDYSTGAATFSNSVTTNSTVQNNLIGGAVLTRDNGTAQIEVNIRHNSNRNGVVSFTENGVADRWAIGTKPGDGTLYFASGFDLSTPRLTLSSAGNVQIGSSANSAGYGLEVYGGNQRVVIQDNANGTAGVFFRVLSGGSQVGNVTLRTDNTGTFSVFTGTSGEGERMRITSGGDVSMTGTGAMKIHSGTTAQRPSATAGQIRYNTSLGEVEVNNGSNWGSLQTKVMLGSSPSNPAESANDIKTYYPNATNGFYWIKQTGSTAVSAYCVFKDFTGADIQGGPWTVPIISNDANTNFSTNGPAALATFLSKCQAIGINTPGRGMESSRTTTEVYGAWLAVKRAIWEAYTPFVANGNTVGGSVLRMPMININGEGGATAHRLVYNTSLSTHIPPNIDGDACNAAQLFCGWWSATDISGWRTNNNDLPGPEDWGPSDTNNTSYNGAGVNSTLTVCVYK